MIRFPRRIAIGTAAVALGLLAAQGATGRTQTKPSNGQEPFISGPYLLQVGTSLTGHKGEWSGTEPISYQYQWMRCAPDASNCKAISNADVTSYKVKDADVGHTLRFQVTAKNADG